MEFVAPTSSFSSSTDSPLFPPSESAEQEKTLQPHRPAIAARHPRVVTGVASQQRESTPAEPSTSLTAVHQLPSEVLSLIFAGSLESTADQHGTRFTLNTLRGVCTRWRGVATHAAQLWTFLQITHKHKLSVADVRDIWLARSPARPLDIDLDLTRHDAQNALDLLRLVASHSERWRHVTLRTPAEFLYRLADAREHLPALQSLRMTFEDVSYFRTAKAHCRRTLPLFRDVFKCAPQLRSLHLRNVPLCIFKFPLDQIHNLTLQGFDSESSVFLFYLSRCENLRRCVLYPRPLSPSSWQWPGGIVICKTLKALTIYLTDPLFGEVASFCEHVGIFAKLPQLEELAVRVSTTSPHAFPASTFRAVLLFIRLTGSCLRKLELHDVPFEEMELRKCSASTEDTIEELTISSNAHAGNVLPLLAALSARRTGSPTGAWASASTPLILPNLSCFSFTLGSPAPENHAAEDALIAMIDIRREEPNALQKVYVRAPGWLALQERAEKWKEDGLVIVVRVD